MHIGAWSGVVYSGIGSICLLRGDGEERRGKKEGEERGRRKREKKEGSTYIV